MKRLFSALCILLIASCTPQGQMDSAMADKDGVVISDARVRAPLPGRDIAAAYFRIDNFGPKDALLSVTSPVSERVELHTHLNEDGIMKMRRVDTVALPENGDVTFKPGGLHVMMFGAAFDENETDVALTFNFETAPSVTIIADIGMGEPKSKADHSAH